MTSNFRSDSDSKHHEACLLFSMIHLGGLYLLIREIVIVEIRSFTMKQKKTKYFAASVDLLTLSNRRWRQYSYFFSTNKFLSDNVFVRFAPARWKNLTSFLSKMLWVIISFSILWWKKSIQWFRRISSEKKFVNISSNLMNNLCWFIEKLIVF